MTKKIAILTSGGDAPGMNSAVRAVVKTAKMHGIQPFLVREGYRGLCENLIESASGVDVDTYLAKGGTFIYSSRFPEFREASYRRQAKDNLSRNGIDSLVVIGGDGTYKGAQLLHDLGIQTIALPGTIDNDISSTEFTIGYSTALKTVVDSVSKLRDTMTSHHRVAIVEVMGHGCGDLTLYGGLATGAEIIITNEVPLSVTQIATQVRNLTSQGKRSLIILVSEFIFKDLHHTAKEISHLVNQEVKPVVLSHLQRGGVPTVEERILATKLGIKAVELIIDNKSGLSVGIVGNKVQPIPILEALSMPRQDQTALTKKIAKLNQI